MVGEPLVGVMHMVHLSVSWKVCGGRSVRTGSKSSVL